MSHIAVLILLSVNAPAVHHAKTVIISPPAPAGFSGVSTSGQLSLWLLLVLSVGVVC